MADVQIGDRTVTIERFTLAKTVRIITLLTELQRQVPEVTREWATFRKDYGDTYAVELDRVQALVQYPDRPVFDADDNPVILDDGSVATLPSQVSKLTDEDWDRVGQVFRLPASPSPPEVFMHMAPIVFDRAQEPAMRLLALVAMENEKVSKYVASGSLYERLDEFAHDVLDDADLADIMELVAVAAEVIDTSVLAKARTLGKRLAPLRAMFGFSPTDETETTTSTSSQQPAAANIVTATGSPESSDGTPSKSDDSPSTSSATTSSSPEKTPTTITEGAPA